MAYDIFISYRRDGGEYTAKLIRDRLEDLGYQVFFDVESLRSGYFNTKLYSVIDECQDVLLILPPGSLDRCQNPDDWVRLEIEHAMAQEKNIIPVMLRGFEFPAVLPPSLEPIRYLNGLEANSQFFDAFIQQLCGKFLVTKPRLRRRVVQNTVFRRTLPLLLALLILVAAGFGGKRLYDSWNAAYPGTTAEKNLTNELLYYTENNLTRVELIAEASQQAIDSARRALLSGSGNSTELKEQFAVSRQTLDNIDLEACALDPKLLERLSDSPFSTADVTALYDTTKSFLTAWSGYLDYLEQITGPDYYLSTENKLQILDCYESILSNSLQSRAYCCNQLLLPITDTSALQTFWQVYLPELTYFPLRADTWQTDYDLLESGVNQCYNDMEKVAQQLATLVGNTRMDNAVMEEALLRYLMTLGFTREEAETLMSMSSELQDMINRIRSACQPSSEDDSEMLWFKMKNLLAIACFDDARDCAALWAQQNPERTQVSAAVDRAIGYMEENGVFYGVMVMDYYEPDGINEVLQLGDIIVSFDGQPCGSYTAYMDMKSQLTSTEYTLELLRADEDGALALMTVELSTEMPKVWMNTLVYDGTEE